MIRPEPARGTGRSPRAAAALALLAVAAMLLAATGAVPTESPALTSALRHLERGGFDHERLETRHFIILSDADPAWTRDQGLRLERTHQEFLRSMRRLGLTPQPLRHRLVCVLFGSRDDYRGFARAADGVVGEWVAGYYSPSGDRTVFYDARTNPSVVAARERLAELEQDLDDLAAKARSARRDGDRDLAGRLERQHAAWSRHLGGEHDRINAFTDEVGVATTVHEATHHLLFHTGIQSGTSMPPLWISEGLATAFETDDPTGAFGPDFEYPARRDRFQQLLDEDRLVPLRDLVTITQLGATHGHGHDHDHAPGDAARRVDVVYHQSYALVIWLFAERRSALRGYLERLRTRSPTTEAELLETFEDSFGPADRLESRWLAAERRSAAARGRFVSQPTDDRP